MGRDGAMATKPFSIVKYRDELIDWTKFKLSSIIKLAQVCVSTLNLQRVIDMTADIEVKALFQWFYVLVFSLGIFATPQSRAQDINVSVHVPSGTAGLIELNGVLTTPPIRGDQFVCVVANTSRSNVTIVGVRVYNEDGAMVQVDTTDPGCPRIETSDQALSLAPHKMCYVNAATPPVASTPKTTHAYCEVVFYPKENRGVRSTIWSRENKSKTPDLIVMTAHGLRR